MKRFLIFDFRFLIAAAVTCALAGCAAECGHSDAARLRQAPMDDPMANYETVEVPLHSQEIQARPQSTSFTPKATVITVATAPATSPNGKWGVHYSDAPLDDVIRDMARTFGYVFVRSMPTPGRITIDEPRELDAEQSIKLLNDLLTPQGYAVMITQTPGPDSHTVVRVVINMKNGKSEIPIVEARNPQDVPASSSRITAVIPVYHLDAMKLREDLMPIFGTDADVTANPSSNSIIVTDTAARIHHVLEIMEKLDPPPPATNKGDRP